MSDAQAAPVTENGVHPVAQEKVEEAPGHKVFVGNLAYATTDEGLKALFAPFASDILSAQVIQRPIPRGGNTIRSAGYGFVALSTAEAAQNAIDTLDKKELDGREVIVQLAKPSEQKEKEKKEKKAKRRPGRRGSKAVPGEVSEAEANGDAPQTEAIPAPESDDAAKPKKKKKSKAARKAKKAAAAAAAVDGAVADETPAAPATEGDAPAAEGYAKKPRARKPRTPRPPRPAGEDPAGEPSTTMLFVANLGFSVDDAGLSALFTEAGINVVSARIVRRRWGQPRKSKGYGFVDVGNEEEQKKAIAALEGKEVGGRAIAVKVAVNTPHEETGDEATPAAADGAAAPAATTA
ncbi:RNA-binding domain-containing protein [Pholiota conissans]|uniref:RNA-binding domain-containing protein n=1 Tax=Pholiota conissans TaxID=109636 RepID=A0A9P6CXD9_9AGAR|nr:RNA-binding domain-containing protein [Pholiota conissans]